MIPEHRSDPGARTQWQWPQDHDHCGHFLQILGAALEGGSTISECFLTAARISPGDNESWYREWKTAADLNKERGDAARERDNICTAQNNWLRASNYYRAAGLFLELDDSRRLSTAESMRSCAQLHLGHKTPAGEIIRIPCGDDSSLQGYFLRAPASPNRAPVVVCVGGPTQCKEEYLWKMPRHALARGLSLLLVDLPGQDAVRRSGIAGRYDIEMAISGCLDYLITRDDVDERRIAIYGDGLGASFATRAAASDHRFAAAVCDGGLWDLHERAYALAWIAGSNAEPVTKHQIEKLYRFGLAKRIKCPMLVTLGEIESAHISEAAELVDFHKQAGLDIDLGIFAAAETAVSQLPIGGSPTDIEHVCDWIVSRLHENRST